MLRQRPTKGSGLSAALDRIPYRCSLPGLTRFGNDRCTGPEPFVGRCQGTHAMSWCPVSKGEEVGGKFPRPVDGPPRLTDGSPAGGNRPRLGGTIPLSGGVAPLRRGTAPPRGGTVAEPRGTIPPSGGAVSPQGRIVRRSGGTVPPSGGSARRSGGTAPPRRREDSGRLPAFPGA